MIKRITERLGDLSNRRGFLSRFTIAASAVATSLFITPKKAEACPGCPCCFLCLLSSYCDAECYWSWFCCGEPCGDDMQKWQWFCKEGFNQPSSCTGCDNVVCSEQVAVQMCG